MKKFILIVVLLLLSACRQNFAAGTALPTSETTIPSATATPEPSVTSTNIFTPTVTLTFVPTFEVCSPLEEETFQTLPSILINPLDVPPFGQDSGHHGLDFAYFQRGTRESIQGIEVYAILSGKTVLTLEDDLPYGYTILIETPLNELPEQIQETLLAQYLLVPENPDYRLYCPDAATPSLSNEYSVYHLYAHLEAMPAFSTGDIVSCGEQLGTVGNSGWSSSPHLHLETRLGPSGANFSTMAHYENSNTIEQMANYCLWRMSGYYQLFDPFLLFDAAE